MEAQDMLQAVNDAKEKIERDLDEILDSDELPSHSCYKVIRKRYDMIAMIHPIAEYLANGFTDTIVRCIEKAIALQVQNMRREAQKLVVKPQPAAMPWIAYWQEIGRIAVSKSPWAFVLAVAYVLTNSPLGERIISLFIQGA